MLKCFNFRIFFLSQVEISIDDSDKNGVVLGRIYAISDSASKGGKALKSPYALSLVAAGYARVDVRHALERPSSEMTELQEAQKVAIEGRRAMWSVEETVAEEVDRQSGRSRNSRNGQEDENNDEGEDVVDAEVSKLAVSNGGGKSKGPSLRGDEEKVKVRLCEITDGCSFFVHVMSEVRQKQLKSVEQQMTAFAATHSLPVPPSEGSDPIPTRALDVKKGQLVLAQFDDRSGSGPTWFRAKVEEVEPGQKKARVQFIDYGNRAIVNTAEIAAVDSSSPSSSASKSAYFVAPPLAIECSLAFLSAPSLAEDQGGDGLIIAAGRSLGDLAWDRDLSMQVIHICQ